jgi:hypothetical protein
MTELGDWFRQHDLIVEALQSVRFGVTQGW